MDRFAEGVSSKPLPQGVFLAVYFNSLNISTNLSPFQIIYGMHPRGVYELRNFGQLKMRSDDGEDFATSIQELHEQVKK